MALPEKLRALLPDATEMLPTDELEAFIKAWARAYVKDPGSAAPSHAGWARVEAVKKAKKRAAVKAALAGIQASEQARRQASEKALELVEATMRAEQVTFDEALAVLN